MVAVVLRHPIATVSRGSCGYSRPEPGGAICRRSIPVALPAGGGSGSGKRKTSGSKPGSSCWPPSTTASCCNGRKPSWTAASWLPKRGRCRGKNQAREGDKVDGTGRWPGHTARSATHECFAGRGHACRVDAGAGESSRLGARSTATETPAHHRRSRLRLQPAARPIAPARHRVVGPPPPESPIVVASGWSQTSALPPKMENQAYLCLVAEFPPAGNSL